MYKHQREFISMNNVSGASQSPGGDFPGDKRRSGVESVGRRAAAYTCRLSRRGAAAGLIC